MKRVAVEIECEDEQDAAHALTIIGAEVSHLGTVKQLVEPSPQTYHPERRWLAPS
jgi:hypothetical protein